MSGEGTPFDRVKVTLNGQLVEGWADEDVLSLPSLSTKVPLRDPRVVPVIAIYEGDADRPTISLPMKDEAFVERWHQIREMAEQARADGQPLEMSAR